MPGPPAATRRPRGIRRRASIDHHHVFDVGILVFYVQLDVVHLDVVQLDVLHLHLDVVHLDVLHLHLDVVHLDVFERLGLPRHRHLLRAACRLAGAVRGRRGPDPAPVPLGHDRHVGRRSLADGSRRNVLLFLRDAHR
jgi:hypothetical protein